MKKSKAQFKRILLCLLSTSFFCTTGSVFADEIPTIIADENAESDSTLSTNTETVEEITISSAEVKRLFQYIGKCDGFDIYKRNENYYNNSNSPDINISQEDLTILSSSGDLVLMKNDVPKAFFNKHYTSNGELAYISDAERFIITINNELTKPIHVFEVISTLDNPLLFANSDKSELYLMSPNLSDIDETYKFSKTEKNHAIYTSISSDENVWLNSDKTQFLTFTKCITENENLRLLFNEHNISFGIENKENGYIWWSSPIGAERDTTATPLLINDLRSSSVLTYGIPDARSTKTVRSNTPQCAINSEKIDNGIRITYDFKSAGFRYPVDYTLENDHLKVSLKKDNIEEYTSGNIATQITLLGAFGAGATDENGYFIIPDGSGSLINFNNGKNNADPYSQTVYGPDITAVPNKKGPVTQQIFLNMFGIVKEDNAMLVVASKGDSNAVLNASVSKQSKTDFNLCNFTFILRDTDTFYLSGDLSSKLTVFEGGKIKSDDIELLYFPIYGENISYVDVADKYRNYLVENNLLSTKTTPNSAPLYVDFYGGTMKKTSFLGIPISMKKSITNFDQTKEILSNLKAENTNDIVVSYNNWTNDGISEKIDVDAKPSRILGGKKDFNSLKKYISSNDFELYPTAQNRAFYAGNGFHSFIDSTVRISGSYSQIVSYDRAFGVKNEFKKPMSLLSPSSFNDVFSDLSSNYKSNKLNGISLGDTTASLYGDYGKKNISRYNAMKKLCKNYNKINSSLGNGILADTANSYAFPYISHIKNLPLCSSRFDIFDEDIPFIQLVLHGYIPYSTTAVNADADAENLILSAISTGSNIHYDMIHEDANLLKDTSLDSLFYASADNWISAAAAEYSLVSDILADVSSCTITDYQRNGDVAVTTYSNGKKVTVDFGSKTVKFDGKTVNLTEYSQKGGFAY